MTYFNSTISRQNTRDRIATPSRQEERQVHRADDLRRRARLAREAFAEPSRQPPDTQPRADDRQPHADPGTQIRKRKTFHSSFPP